MPVVRSGAENCSNRAGEAVKWLTQRSLNRGANGAARAFGCRRTCTQVLPAKTEQTEVCWSQWQRFLTLFYVTASGSETICLPSDKFQTARLGLSQRLQLLPSCEWPHPLTSGLKVRGVGMQIPSLMSGESRHV